MSDPQTGVFAPSQPHQYAVEFTIAETPEPDTIRSALRMLRLVLNRHEGGTTHVVAFGPSLYRDLAGNRAPETLKDFETISGSGDKSALASQRDVLVWLQGPSRDVVFDVALAAQHALLPVASCPLDVSGFVYHDSRDLTGFIDGSANPTGDLIAQTALVADGLVGAGGAHMLTQKWVHDLDAFNALAVADQERVIGRTKEDSIELEGDAMPVTSHVSRTDVKIDGNPQRLYRRSFPYGSISENGLYFLSFCCDPTRFDIQLRRMYGVSGDGLSDRLIDFSKTVSGSYWFAPSQDDLDALTG